MKVTLLLIVVLISGNFYAQLPKEMYKRKWKEGKEKEMLSHVILREEGANNLFAVTNYIHDPSAEY